MKVPYYRECPICHCNLDPGEVCDCQQKEEQEAKDNNEKEAKSA